MDKHGSHQKLALLAGVLIGAAGAALAQQAPPNDAAKMFKGTVAQYSLTPRGDVDGLILADGTEIFWPPHFSTQLVFSIRPGDAVTIQGWKVGVTPMVAAESVTNDATSLTVANMGPSSPPKRGGRSALRRWWPPNLSPMTRPAALCIGLQSQQFPAHVCDADADQ